MYARLVPTTRYPFVHLIEASGIVARESERVVAIARDRLEQERVERARLHAEFQMRLQQQNSASIKNIEQFRADARYGGMEHGWIWHTQSTRSRTVWTWRA
jgi:hypothetical protein